MRFLVVSDIHANLTALQAVLAAEEAARCDRMISLGDQVNFGPCPRQVLELLGSKNCVMLLGNHEERLSRMDDPALRGYGWNMLRWTCGQIAGCRTDFPVDYRVGPVLCTHGVPGDPYRLVDAEGARALLPGLPEGVTLLLSGHNHISWRVEAAGRCAVNPGSLGMCEDGSGCTAPFLTLTQEGGRWRCERHTVRYSPDALHRDFLRSGILEAAPELAEVVEYTMRTGERHATLRFTSLVRETGLDPEDRPAWQEALRRFRREKRIGSGV